MAERLILALQDASVSGLEEGAQTSSYELTRHLQSVRDLTPSPGTDSFDLDLKANGQAPIFYFHAEPRQQQTMKTPITSNLRPHSCALYTLLFTITAPWAISTNAQLYATQQSTLGIMSEYNATSGAPISASFITGLNVPKALAQRENVECD